MSGRHRSSRGSRRTGWFVAGAGVAVVMLGALLTAFALSRQPPVGGPGTDPEAGVSMRTYPVPRATAPVADVARNLRTADTSPPTARRPAATHPAVTRRPRRSRTKPERAHPTRICHGVRHNGHSYGNCASHPPHH